MNRTIIYSIWVNRLSLQPKPSIQATQTQYWTRLILSYARHRRLFTLRIEDCEAPGSDWDEILRNDKINRVYFLSLFYRVVYSYTVVTGKVLPQHLTALMTSMVAQNVAAYEPPKQMRSVLLYWRLPEEWAEVLHDWVCVLYRAP